MKSDRPASPARPGGKGRPHGATAHDRLRDFTTDSRLLLLALMALVVGTAGAAAAWALLHLITLATNLAYYGKLSATPAPIVGNGLWGSRPCSFRSAGCLIIGLDGAVRLGEDPRPRHSRGDRSDPDRPQPHPAQGRAAQAALVGHLHRHRRPVRRRRADHHDRRRVRLAVRPAVPSQSTPSARPCWSPAPPPA